MLIATLVLTLMGLALGGLLGLAAKFFAPDQENPLVKEVEEMLPGSQCGQCGMAGCGVAAEAMVNGTAELTCCPPGGRALAEALAEKLGVDLSSLGEAAAPKLAFIKEELCTGCTRCFKACPTDAIVGANKQLHTVMDEACTGCGVCVDTCPEDCITLEEEALSLDTWHWHKPEAA